MVSQRKKRTCRSNQVLTMKKVPKKIFAISIMIRILLIVYFLYKLWNDGGDSTSLLCGFYHVTGRITSSCSLPVPSATEEEKKFSRGREG